MPALTGLLIKFYITPYAMQWGVSLNMSFYLSSILNAGACFGCYAVGVAADRGLGSFNAITIVAFGCAVTAFGWIGARNNAGIIVWTIIYGFLSGAVQALFSPCISHLAPEPRLIGTWNGKPMKFSSHSCIQLCINNIPLGICITVVAFAVLGTGPIAGQLLDNTQGLNYLPMKLFTAVFLIVASAFYFVTRLLVSRKAFI